MVVIDLFTVFMIIDNLKLLGKTKLRILNKISKNYTKKCARISRLFHLPHTIAHWRNGFDAPSVALNERAVFLT